MSAFTPISPKEAAELMDAAGVPGLPEVLADFAVGGFARTYARLTETIHTGGQRIEVRDAAIPRELWRRIIADRKATAVWDTGTVRLDGSPHQAQPAVTVLGIRYNREDVALLASQHGCRLGGASGGASPAPAPAGPPLPAPPSPAQAELPIPSPATETAGTPAEAAKPASTRKAKAYAPTMPDPNALTVTVDEAVALAGLSRTTIYDRMNDGSLVSTTVGRRRLILMDSLRKLVGGNSAGGPSDDD